jgi:nucleoside-diphosphate-sugar epimerase
MIILTGGSGFLGSYIKNSIDAHGIICLGRRNADYLYDLTTDIPRFHYKINLVIHSAGKAHAAAKTDKERQEFFRVNVIGTENLLKGLEQSSFLPQSFVFISSVAVYGKERGILLKESESLSAKDPYGQSKVLAEELIIEWCAKHNVICTILRLPLIAGSNPPGNLQAMIKGIKNGYYFNIAGGKAKKSMILAEDVAKIIPAAAKVGGIYNLTDGYHPSFLELSELIAKQLNKNKPAEIPSWIAKFIAKIGDIVGSKAPINSDKLKKITSDLTFDDSKARELLGWNPTPVLKGFKIA